MNPNRKIKIVHLNVPGHFPYSMCGNPSQLFYCFEEGEENKGPHTHIGAVLTEPMSKNQILDWFEELNEDPDLPPWTDDQGNTRFGLQRYQIEIADGHKQFGSVWGYHYGFGKKTACEPAPVWVTMTKEEVDQMIADRRHHSKITTCAQQSLKTLDLLERTPIQNLKEGKIALRGYRSFCADWAEAMQDIGQVQQEENKAIELEPEKKRHHWLYGESNVGKSYTAKNILAEGDYFFAPDNNDWRFYKGEQFIIFDEYRDEQVWPASRLQKLCDANGYTINVKGTSKLLRRDAVIIICSHLPLSAVYADAPLHELKGLFNRFNVTHLTKVWP